MVLEVRVVVMVPVVIKVGVGDTLGEVLFVSKQILVVHFFFGGLDLFFRGAPYLRLSKKM